MHSIALHVTHPCVARPQSAAPLANPKQPHGSLRKENASFFGTSGAFFRFFLLSALAPPPPTSTHTFQATGRAGTGIVPYFRPIEVALKWSISDTAVWQAGKNAQFLSSNRREAIFEAISPVQKNVMLLSSYLHSMFNMQY
jgi:hypothetical protein